MNYKSIHKKLSQQTRHIMPEHLERLAWSREKIDAFQTQQLRTLLKHVSIHSPYYQKLLKPYDIDVMTPNDLKQLPKLTKQTVLDNWDEIVCVPELTKAKAEAHLEALRNNPNANPFFNNQYYVTATGGSSGLRGLYAWNLDYFSNLIAVDFRYQIQDEQNTPGFTPRVTAVLTAPSPIHASTPLCTSQLDTHDKILHIPADLPLQAICGQLNQLKPTHLIGYASIITRLARAALNGQLSIAPKRATTNSEPLNDRGRETILKAWGIQTNNTWGSVEMGIAGIENDKHQGLLLSEDMIIFEPAEKQLIITNLFNTTLPLIRYVVDDIVDIQTAALSAYKLTPHIAGRSDDWFIYPNQVEIHPMIFWDIFEREPLISEYQVQQTKTGVIIRVVAYPGLALEMIQTKLVSSLKQLGLTHPSVSLKQVKTIARHQETGKLKRFIPLAHPE
jgi:phenylacetate-CoA ligase